MYMQNRNRRTDREKKLMVTRGERKKIKAVRLGDINYCV